MLRSARTSLLLATFLLGGLLASGPAEAKDMRGKLGIGALTSLAGANGLTIRYWASRSVGIELLGGVAVTGINEGDETRSGVAGGMQLLYVLREIGRTNLLAGLRGVVGFRGARSVESGERTDSLLHFAVEVPLTIEHSLSDAFSIQLSAGFVLSFVPDDGPVLDGGPLFLGMDDDPGTNFGFGSGGLLGSAGFSFYF